MVQKPLASKAQGRAAAKSAGAKRKYVGDAKKKTTRKKISSTRRQAASTYISAVESSMASRLPSDQRSKLSLLKASGPQVAKKNKKKPLTRGRKRKAKKS